MLEDGTYNLSGRDPITEVLGPQHGGRTRGISSSVGVRTTMNWKGKRKMDVVVPDMEAFKEKIINQVRTDLLNEIRAQMRGQRGEIQDNRQTTSKHPELAPRQEGISSPDFRGSSCASGGSYDTFDDIKERIECDLLWPYPGSDLKVASRMVHPTRDGILHRSYMSHGYLKVQVDDVEKDYLRIPSPKPYGDVNYLADAIHHFIQ